MKPFWRKFNRKFHYWAALAIGLPLLIVICSGILLQLKKDVDYIQPPTKKGSWESPLISFEKILEVVKGVPQANLNTWNDIDRLDVRPGKGVVKVRGKNKWEVQIDTSTGEVLQVAYRRSDLIESIHDGSWFHDNIKMWIFLPSAFIFLLMWITGIYMFITTLITKKKSKKIKL